MDHSGCYQRRAFSLIEMAFVIVFAGMVASVALTMNQTSTKDCLLTTKNQLADIDKAIDRFVMTNDRMPLPAQRDVGVESPLYGREAASTAPLNEIGAPAIVFGALPTQALGLSPAYASDCWGNKFTYAVTKDLTDKVMFLARNAAGNPTYVGAITVQGATGNVITSTAAHIVVSHGADGVGAVKSNHSGSKGWCAASAVLQSNNCDVGNAIFVESAMNDGKASGNLLYDDLVSYAGKNMRVLDGVCSGTLGNCTAGTSVGYNGITCQGIATWTCNGKNGGANKACSVDLTATMCPINGVCGLHGTGGSAFPNAVPPSGADLCNTGPASAVAANPATYTWSCAGQFGGSPDNCTATRTAATINGSCGGDHGGTFGFSAPPSGDLCGNGTASAVTTNPGTYTWSCNGSGTMPPATNAPCSATRSAAPVNGVCGTDNGGMFGFTNPPTDLCGAGVASAVTSTANSYNWSCAGIGGGASTATCTATRTAATINGACGSDAGNSFGFSTPPSAALCNAGTETAVTPATATYTWSCIGSGTMPPATNAPCTAIRTAAPVNGRCGASHSGTFGNTTPPTINLCDEGSESGVSSTVNSYKWTCDGANTGSTAACSATRAAPVIDGLCGPADGQTFGNANTPNAGLCTNGTATGVTVNANTYTWGCTGSGGGHTDDSCSANRSAAPVDGGWSAWSPWSCPADVNQPCTSTRTCTNPPPANSGAPCSGSDTQTQANTRTTCTYNGSVSWGGSCNAPYNGTIAVGQSFTATNTNGGFTGTATYNCTAALGNGGWSTGANSCAPSAPAFPGNWTAGSCSAPCGPGTINAPTCSGGACNPATRPASGQACNLGACAPVMGVCGSSSGSCQSGSMTNYFEVTCPDGGVSQSNWNCTGANGVAVYCSEWFGTCVN